MPNTTRSKPKFTRYLVFQTWIIAMLNNEDLIDTTEQLAQALREHAESGEKGRTKAKRRAEQVLDASREREFLEALTEVVENDGSHASLFDEIADEVVKMPSSDFPLFATLLRLKYKVFSQQQSV
jgi:chorismate mutase